MGSQIQIGPHHGAVIPLVAPVGGLDGPCGQPSALRDSIWALMEGSPGNSEGGGQELSAVPGAPLSSFALVLWDSIFSV